LTAIRNHQINAEIIDAHFLFPDGAAAVLVARRLGVPVVLTARGSDVNVIANEMAAGRWIRWALRNADALVAVSRDLAERMRALSGGRSVTVIRNGIDTSTFHDRRDRASLRQRLGFDAFTLLSVGNLIELKGHARAIEAVARLPDANLIVIGDGPLAGELAALIDRLGVASRIRLLPSMAQTKLAEYYAAADGLILASSHEGMQNVVLESLASGTPVVATPTGGALEVLEASEAGLICGRDVDAIAAAIERLRSLNVDRARVPPTVAHFDWHSTSTEVYDVFRRATLLRQAKVAHP
jgi:glycosyltransferase involved in cell wall biosynthesis